MSDYNAPADLHRHKMSAVRKGKAIPSSHRRIHSGPFVECSKMFMATAAPERVLYSITVALKAGFGKNFLEHADIEAITRRADFPNK
jgi:hypothetical protein